MNNSSRTVVSGTVFCYNHIRDKRRMEEFKVTIEQFDGPLDLMLHLIREQKLDLMNLDMSILADQYIAFLSGMEKMHLEIAGEYLLEMATLIEYKSRKMLPGREDETEAEEEDPRERLVRRLLEYQQFKEVSEDLGQMYEDRQKHLSRPVAAQADEWMKQNDSDFRYHGSPYELMKAMRRCMMRMRLATPQDSRYTVKEISVEDRETEVRAKLDRLPETFRFEALLDDCTSTPMFIATFLAVLDLARLHRLVFTVDEEDVIWFSRGEHAE